MNELLFLAQIIIALTTTIICWRWSKEALIVNAVLQALFANIFLLKQISLFGLEVTASDVFAVGSLLSINFLQEFHGRKAASLTTWISFFSLLLFTLFSQLHLLYCPSLGDKSHCSYAALFSVAPRIFFSSLVAFWAAQQFDLRFFGWLTHKAHKLTFPMRSTLSLIASQGLDTVLFTFLALYGIASSIRDISLISFFIKCLTICVFFPLVSVIKNYYEPT